MNLDPHAQETIPLKAISQLKSLKLFSDKNLTLLKIDYSIELNKMGGEAS